MVFIMNKTDNICGLFILFLISSLSLFFMFSNLDLLKSHMLSILNSSTEFYSNKQNLIDIKLPSTITNPVDTLKKSSKVLSTPIGSGKNGYCYIGDDKGVRHCIHVNKNHKCMSNEIHESSEICKHPNLRY